MATPSLRSEFFHIRLDLLQELEVDKRLAETVKLRAEADRARLVNQLAVDEDAARAKILADLTCPCGPIPVAEP
ncbi:MAG TPA: hypothetical protein VFU46_08250 [Gemmatimonadales bacterium]|nr:hypothetical protein [Gemmatimonadales bacterium]